MKDDKTTEMKRNEIKSLSLGYLWELCYRAHCGTSFYPEKRADMYVQGYSEQLEADLKVITEHECDLERFENKFKDLFSTWMRAKGRCMSSMITGPANFPVRRMEKLNRYEQNAFEKFSTWREKVLKRVARGESTAIVKGSEGALDKMLAKLALLEKAQDNMKTINKIVRSKKTDKTEKMHLLIELLPKEKETTLKSYLVVDCMGTIGFAGYSLTNNGAKIRNLKKDIEAEKRRAKKYEDGNKETVVKGITIIENVDENRLQLVFDGKPSEEIRKELKSYGLRWSGKFGAWQRQLTNNAIYTINRFLQSYPEETI